MFDTMIETNKIRIIDLFAGIGGMRLGFENVSKDIMCVFTSELDKYAQQTYLQNFNDSMVHGDIIGINESLIPEHDILLGGFPCQPFSQAGLKKGFLDTRGTLFFEIERILIAKKPQAFLLENVKQLIKHDGGKTLTTIIKHLKNIGYDNVKYGTLKAREFGLPQNRERIYIVGFLDNNVKFEFPKPTFKPTKVGDILEKYVDNKYTISDKMWKWHQQRKISNVKKGNPGFSFGIVNENSEYTRTITARYGKDGGEILLEQVNKNPRRLTPRELANLQGFPKTFKIPVSDNQAYKQFGNTVSINVIEKIAIQILKHISISD